MQLAVFSTLFIDWNNLCFFSTFTGRDILSSEKTERDFPPSYKEKQLLLAMSGITYHRYRGSKTGEILSKSQQTSPQSFLILSREMTYFGYPQLWDNLVIDSLDFVCMISIPASKS